MHMHPSSFRPLGEVRQVSEPLGQDGLQGLPSVPAIQKRHGFISISANANHPPRVIVESGDLYVLNPPVGNSSKTPSFQRNSRESILPTTTPRLLMKRGSMATPGWERRDLSRCRPATGMHGGVVGIQIVPHDLSRDRSCSPR